MEKWTKLGVQNLWSYIKKMNLENLTWGREVPALVSGPLEEDQLETSSPPDNF
jgi:hypothetical protein